MPITIVIDKNAKMDYYIGVRLKFNGGFIMKETYNKPQVEVEEYNAVDVLTVSNGGNGNTQLDGGDD